MPNSLTPQRRQVWLKRKISDGLVVGVSEPLSTNPAPGTHHYWQRFDCHTTEVSFDHVYLVCVIATGKPCYCRTEEPDPNEYPLDFYYFQKWAVQKERVTDAT